MATKKNSTETAAAEQTKEGVDPTISEHAEHTLAACFHFARQQRHEFVTVEHLMLLLLDDTDAKPVLEACAVNVASTRQQLESYIENNTPVVPGTDAVDTHPTLGFQRVVQRAIMHVMATSASMKSVTGANLLVAIFGEKDSHSVFLLQSQGVTRTDVVEFIVHGIRKSPEDAKTIDERLYEIARSFRAEPPRSTTGAPTKADSNKEPKRLRIFVSYSHVDADCLSRLLVHLRPLERQSLIDSWSDRRIKSGEKWRSELKSNLESAAVAILLISADFLASDFIANDELPPILVKAEAEGMRVIPVILKPCGFLRDPVLQNFQAVNDPSKPLLGMPTIDQEFVYDKVAAEIFDEIRLREINR